VVISKFAGWPPMEEAFDNTEITFRGKSDKDLNRAYWLFRILHNSILTKIGMKLTDFAIKTGLPVNNLIKSTIFKHFCGGETIKQCEPTIRKLSDRRVGSILDYSVEEGQEESIFRKTFDEIIRTLHRAHGDAKIPFTVFKVTGIGGAALLEKVSSGKELTLSEEAAFFKLKARINQICRTASELEVRVMLDAEESWIQNSIDNIAMEMIRSYNREKAIVYNTYQLYRTDKLASLKADIYLAETDGFILGAKLVRGAYMEKERLRAKTEGYQSPVYTDKMLTDRDYNESFEFCIKHLKNTAFIAGTHNEYSCMLLTSLLLKNNIPAGHPHAFFSQLLGMGDNLSFNLADDGYNVAKYVPYGPIKAVLPYLFRRAEENTSVTGRAGRELELIVKERRRRKLMGS
jgi:proline dehydrogenase